ncbi:LysR family transcriptional regulator [Agrobacterium radiobacter]|uniref:LysR family transcriptional regulator n=1 Tax=Agrobacterium radiobacter TaxID=362 RepID=UPI003F837E3D
MRKTGNFDKLYLYHTKPDNTKTCPPMDIRQLTIFVEAARARNFRAAALQLGIAQPAVTQRIRQLEENLGFKLFHRINRGVELTPAGQSMLIEAEEILARTKGALEKAQQIRRGQLGTLRIGYGTSVMAERKLPALITRYGDEHPDVTLELLPGMTMEQLIEQVATRKTDVAFTRAPLPSLPQTLRAMPFDRSKLCVALPERHALAHRSRISVGDIVHEKLLLPVDEIGLGLSSSALSLFEDAGCTPEIGMRIANVNTILALVEAGAGISILPEATVRSARGIAGVPLESADAWSDCVLVVRRGALALHVEAFVNMARHAYRPSL